MIPPLHLAAHIDDCVAQLAARLASSPAGALSPEEHAHALVHVASALSGLAACMDAQADHMDPTHTDGHGMPWTLMRAARDVRDVAARLSLPARNRALIT